MFSNVLLWNGFFFLLLNEDESKNKPSGQHESSNLANEEKHDSDFSNSDIEKKETGNYQVFALASDIKNKYMLRHDGSALSFDPVNGFFWIKDTKDRRFYDYYVELHFYTIDGGSKVPYYVHSIWVGDWSEPKAMGSFDGRMPKGVCVLRAGVMKDPNLPFDSLNFCKGRSRIITNYEVYRNMVAHTAVVDLPAEIEGEVLVLDVILSNIEAWGD